MSARSGERGRLLAPVYVVLLVGVLAVVVLVVVLPAFLRSRESARKGLVSAAAAAYPGGDEELEVRARAVASPAFSMVASSGKTPESPGAEPAGFEAGAEWSVPGEPMLIRTASLRLRVSDVAKAHEAVAEIAREADGHVADTEFSTEAGPTRAKVIIRVPSRGLDSVIDRIAELGKLLHKRISAQEVTEEYVDLTSRKRNLEREEEQLLALLKRAGKVKDLLEVEQTLGRVRGEIEQIAGRLRYLENRVSLSTVEVDLYGPEPEPTAGGPAWAAGDVARRATRSLIGTGRGLATTGIWLGVYAPVWLPIVVVVALLSRRARGPRQPS